LVKNRGARSNTLQVRKNILISNKEHHGSFASQKKRAVIATAVPPFGIKTRRVPGEHARGMAGSESAAVKTFPKDVPWGSEADPGATNQVEGAQLRRHRAASDLSCSGGKTPQNEPMGERDVRVSKQTGRKLATACPKPGGRRQEAYECASMQREREKSGGGGGGNRNDGDDENHL